ncbi:MAG: glycosyltransferase [Oscillochloridaceae bacterium]|nr:glycosyltransferase [Chloroflexaceae bacterium]MDW8388724.1 glycosyltransferase [Oscillochloridaceae bacterium]
MSSVAQFLHQVLERSGRYRPAIVSLATSSRDPNSVRLVAPGSWRRGARCTAGEWQGLPYRHIGAILAELEFQRYQPRRCLTELLAEFDLIQVVAGTPAWALVTREVGRPVCLFVATTVRMERVARLKRLRGWRKLWLAAMTRAVTAIELAALRHTACVFAESSYTRQLLAPLVPPERLVLSVPGIDTAFFRPGDYRYDGPLLSVGRWGDPRKNCRMLFAAYARLIQALPAAPKLILAGATAPSPEDLTFARSLGIERRVEIHVDLSREALRDLFQEASLFVLPSEEEGLGIVIIEAMACGLPVISTRCGGPETAVVEGETGYLTPVGDAQALANRMAELIEAPELRRRMGQAGRRVAEQRFSLEAAGKVYLDKYDELLSARRP